MNQIYIHDQLIRFSHCDPAMIVYFPRFFDLAHSTMEDWFTEGVGVPLPTLIRDRRLGTPTVSIHCDFFKPLRLGDTLRTEMRILRMGNASVEVEYRGTKDGIEHLRITQTVVFMNLDAARAVPIPDDLHARIEKFLVAPESAQQDHRGSK